MLKTKINLRMVLTAINLLVVLLITRIVVADPLLLEVKGTTNNVYLLGSIHVASQSMYPLSHKIENAFDESDVLVVEIDETKADQVKMQHLIMTKGFYPGAETIQNHVSSDTFELLKKRLDAIHIPYVTIARMRPGMIMLTVTLAKYMQMGFVPELGIDRHFIKKARNRKPIQQLETAEQQLELLLSFSDDNMILEQTLASLDEADQLIPELISAWSNGDGKKLEKLMISDQIKEHPQFAGLFKKLIDDRNITMIEKIKKMLVDTKSYFVVVGAGHLVGEKGIVSILRKQGFTVKRL